MFEGKSDKVKAMNSRSGGFPVKNVLYAVFLLVLIYVVYLYHGSQGKLNETEMTVERYRREASNRITEIQDLIKTKDRLQDSCQNEKHEHGNRINAINQKHAMLQSQFKETEADFMKLKNDMENMRSEHMQAETQHATEYQQFKQQKEFEISGLKDDIANGNQHNEELSRSIIALQQQIQNLQLSQQKLIQENDQLQYQVKDQKKVAVQEQPVVNDLQGNLKVSHQKQMSAHEQARDIVQRMKIAPVDLSNLPGLAKKDIEKDQTHLEALNAQHQVLPPGNNIGLNDAGKDKSPAVLSDSKDETGVNPNDEQKVQIQEPNLDNADKHEGGGEADRDANVNTGDVEEERGAVAAREEEEAGEALNRPLNPLALGQMQEPQLPHKAEQNQQQPPLFPDNSNDANDKDDQYVDDGDDNGDDNGLERREEDQLEEDEEDEKFDENINARELNEDHPQLPRENNYMDRQHDFGAVRDGA